MQQQNFLPSDNDLWVFGYGSLMWRPGFAYMEQHVADIQGYHRSFCILSHVHRGTATNPGLVLGLDQGGSCRGIAFRIPARLRDETVAYLREREQVTGVYLETWLPAFIEGRESISALAYVVDRTHEQYSGALTDEEKIHLISRSRGISGPNPEYVRSTYEQLQRMGIEDPDIARLIEAL